MGKLNWQYALGELVLIFTGITLSLWFNDWSEDKKQRSVEIKTLREIKTEILLDTIDINDNIRSYRAMVEGDSLIHQWLMHALPDTVITSRRIANLDAHYTITFHSSAYETLKSRGVETIRNDSLRLAIVQLYDFDYKLVEQSENQGMMRENRERVFPHFIRNFHITTRLVNGVPQDVFATKNYGALRKDTDFRTVFVENRFVRITMLRRYEKVRAKILSLAGAIDQEIEGSGNH